MTIRATAKKERPFLFPGKFLKRIFDGHLVKRGLELELRCIHKDAQEPVVRRFYGSLRDFKKDWKQIRRLNKRSYHIYFGVVPRDPKNDHKPPQPLILTCIWADIDVGADKSNRTFDDALKRLSRFGIRPTIIVKSGHGIHAYWCLKQPVSIEGAQAKQLLRALAKKVGGDLQSAEIARLLRMPNTINWKDKS